MGSEFFFFAIDRWIAKKNKSSLSNSPCLFGLARCICQINPPRPPLASGLSGWSRAYSRRARGPDAASTAADVAAAAADVAAAAADAAAWRALLRPFICGREVEGRALSVADIPAGVEPVQRGGREGRMLISLGNSENEKTEGKKLHLFPSIGPSTLSFFFPPLSLSLPSPPLGTMCGILAALGLDSLTAEQARRLVLQASKQQRHRGPDDTSAVQLSGGADVIAFERLLIIDPTSSGRCVLLFGSPRKWRAETRGSVPMLVNYRSEARKAGRERREDAAKTTRVFARRRRRRFFQIDGGRPRLKGSSADSSQRDAGSFGGRCSPLIVRGWRQNVDIYA